MIDWYGLAANTLWIAGLALALGTLSYASWQASTTHQKLSARLNAAGFQAALLLAAFLVCAGLFGASSNGLTRLVWGVLGVAALAQIGWLIWRRQPRSE